MKCCLTCANFIEQNIFTDMECLRESFVSCGDTEIVIKPNIMYCDLWEDKDGKK